MTIERIEIVLPIQGRTGTIMAQRIDASGRYVDPIDLQLGFDGSELPQEVQDALTAIDAQQQARIAELESQLSAMTAERDSLATEKSALTSERDSLQSQVAELTTSRDGLQTQLSEATASLATATGQAEALTSERDAALEQIATLQSRINELTAEPDVPIVSRRQARLALLQMGLLETVEGTVAQSPKAVQIEYEGDVWRRDNPTLIAMATALGMNTEQIDQFFALASTK